MEWKRLPLCFALFAGLTFGTAARSQAADIAISCGAVGQELELCRAGAEAWAKATGNTVKVVSSPNSATERLALYQQLLAGGASDIDVFQLDVVWPGILATHFIDLKPYSKGQEAEHFKTIIDNNTVDGKLIAMPLFTDAGVLYYRKDLLDKHGVKVPETWEEMTKAAEAVQKAERDAGNTSLWGFVFQGRAYEGLTVNALEWIDSFGGGTIVDAEGGVTVNNPKAEAALALAQQWVKKIAPEGVLNYAEEEARGVFQSGNAVFMRNWPYAWALANGEDSPVRGKVGVTALPRGNDGGKHTGVLGGWNLAVSRYSKHPKEAADLAMFLTGKDEQKRRAVVASYNPTMPALYEDEDVVRANPFFKTLYSTFTNAVARPSRVTGQNYNRVSYAFWGAVHEVLAGKTEAGPALARLESELKRMSRRGW
ncbi:MULTISPECIES: ABC transporter substrate-binding protein [unclassified Chelatococcus]|uniref:ABC transporter substrate-binding protein n=1 Tax=unclassified Chelatococcus TaxID=2638111 RepID=UPI001BCB11BD|nr:MULTISPECIES: ABC transporter substrate-binding protein [unclassified Chelatococcus]MBS7701202.1 ABC transporter substrate-binding protein [Chelatococcus sp. YT9]MBX3557333.1 ABC transporter substrate-binding protein [Chelatococcus sp.]